MGVVISTNSTLAPISLASSIIGFVSFAFTLATFFKVVWINLETLSEPAHEVHTYLNILREELLEERASLRGLKKVSKKKARPSKRVPPELRDLLALELDEVSLKTMQDNIRHLIRQFEQLESHYLEGHEEGIKQAKKRSRRKTDVSPSPHYEHSAYASPPRGEKRTRSEERENDRRVEDDLYWAQRVRYARYDLGRRMRWIYDKPTAQTLFGTLSRLQTRRIARQVNTIAVMMGELGPSIFEAQDSMSRMDDRLSRVVGVRRVD